MIVAHRKTIPELIEILTGHNKVLVLGCGTCVTVCLAGGQREVGIIASALRMASKLRGHALEVEELTIERQCDNVFIETAAEAIERNDAVFRSAAAPVSRPSPSVTATNRFMPVSIRLSSASLKNEVSGRKNALHAATACCTTTAVSARLHSAPSDC